MEQRTRHKLFEAPPPAWHPEKVLPFAILAIISGGVALGIIYVALT